jgi:N-acetylmuramic acid 6-phosphate etherase
MNDEVKARARKFMEDEKEFHLGFLPTEQPNTKTMTLDKAFLSSTEDGVRMLHAVDQNIVPMAERIFKSTEFSKMKSAIYEAVVSGHKVVFSGCGATGRLSILLESMWRNYFIKLKVENPDFHSRISKYGNSVSSIMTGGDFALVRSVEFFEDYQEFGRQQLREMHVGSGDVLIAITEGGETSSVLGTVQEGVSRDAAVFLLFNNPAELLSLHLQRSREAINNPKVTVLDLHCGPMALTGSTRMQATTSEQLIAGAALESALNEIIGKECKCDIEEIDYKSEFVNLLAELDTPGTVSVLSKYIVFEENIYRKCGLVTYYANGYMLDIFTDTTERSPTFMLPPFRRCDDTKSQTSWGFVKNPMRTTPETWEFVLGRHPRCLNWTEADYRKMGAEQKILMNPPAVSRDDMNTFLIGNEDDPSRRASGINAAVMVIAASEMGNVTFPQFEEGFARVSGEYGWTAVLAIGKPYLNGAFNLPLKIRKSSLELMEHLAVKLVLNTISTGTMVRLGRVTGNWMSYVEVSNKKLIDRGVRIISSLCGLSYQEACERLYETLDEFSKHPPAVKTSPVQHTISKLKGK